MEVDVEAKRKKAEEDKKITLEIKEETRLHIRCFFTRPFGHKYKYVNSSFGGYKKCVGCGRNKYDSLF